MPQVSNELVDKVTAAVTKSVKLVLPPPPPGRSVAVGDSQTRDLDPAKLLRTDVRSRPGGTVKDIHAELSKWLDEREAAEESVGTIYVIGGGNNAEKDGAEPDDIIAEYEELIKNAQTRAKRVVVSSITPRDRDEAVSSVIAAVNSQLEKLCETKRLSYVDLNRAGFYLPDGELNRGFLVDGVHFTQAGLDKVVQCLRIPLAPGVRSSFTTGAGRDKVNVLAEEARRRQRKPARAAQQNPAPAASTPTPTPGVIPVVAQPPVHPTSYPSLPPSVNHQQLQNGFAWHGPELVTGDYGHQFFRHARNKARSPMPNLINRAEYSQPPPPQAPRPAPVTPLMGRSTPCKACGSWNHATENCYSRLKQCNTCKSVGHIARVCPNKVGAAV